VNLIDRAIGRLPERQHRFWKENLGLVTAVLLTEVAWAVCSAVWSLYDGLIAACLGGAVCALRLGSSDWLQRTLDSAPKVLANFVLLSFITEAVILSLVGYGLIRRSEHAAMALAPFALAGIGASVLLWVSFTGNPDPPNNIPRDPEPPDAN